MNIAFVWYYDKASHILPSWRDGLRSAMDLVAKQHKVTWFIDGEFPAEDIFDVVLFWDDSNSPFFKELHRYPSAKKGIFLTTDPTNVDNLKTLDWVFCESSVVEEMGKQNGLNMVRAFGTDTDFFCPDPKVEKDIEYFYPATFSPWKRQSEIASLGPKLLCIGTLQPDGVAELEACEKNNVQRIIDYIPVEKIRDYYRRSQKVIIPAVHGSERTVLEAMANNILPIVNKDNPKMASYVFEFINNQQDYGSPREFVESRYSHKTYAKSILEAINGK